MTSIRKSYTPLVLLLLVGCLAAADVTVHDATGLRRALRQAEPGATIELAPGDYGNGVWIERISGTPEAPIVITAADEARPPVFVGGKEAIHFADCNHIVLRHLKVSGCTSNGINADDGGNFDTPSRGMVFEHLTIENIGPKGNHDGLKLSGLDDFVVRDCTFAGWGGSAIDMVGCHDGVIEGCRFLGQEGHSQDTGVQAKGGCERVLIRRSFFLRAGQRAINLGGSTGRQFFRPELRDYEARAIQVAGNRFVGSMAPIAFATSIDCVVRQNTFVDPEKWVLRILQEQPTEEFLPCQGGVFAGNLVVFDERVRTFVNVGPNTEPETFTFRGNAWFCRDADRRPHLPAKETDGVYQVDPRLADAASPAMKVGSEDPRLDGIGADAYEPDED